MKRKPTTTAQEHTAKREHTCSICGRTIEIGERYRRRVRDTYKGQIRHVKTCDDHFTPNYEAGEH